MCRNSDCVKELSAPAGESGKATSIDSHIVCVIACNAAARIEQNAPASAHHARSAGEFEPRECVELK
jgi:hypothetical protein